ncbi:MAG: hypothetical protein AAGF11_26410 [Myxococcota bacterium]
MRRTTGIGLLLCCLQLACRSPSPEPDSLCRLDKIRDDAKNRPPVDEPLDDPVLDAGLDPALLQAMQEAAGPPARLDTFDLAEEYWSCRLLEAEAQYQVAALQRRSIAFQWHHTASVLIFIMVVSIVCLGFIFAGIQFRRSLGSEVLRAVGSPARRGERAGAEAQALPEGPGDGLKPKHEADLDVEGEETSGARDEARAPSRSDARDPGADLGGDDEPSLHRAHEIELSLQSIRLRSSALGLVIWVVSIAFLYLYLVHVYPLHEGISEEDPNPALDGLSHD